MLFDLPTALEFGGREWAIRSDYRVALRVLAAFADPDLTDGEKVYVCLRSLYPGWREVPRGLWQAALDAAVAFLDHRPGGESAPAVRGDGGRLVDWEQDAGLIFPAVNRVAGFEVRGVEYLHWWTFLGFFMEIRDSAYATVLALRRKVYGRPRRRLEKAEQEYWNAHADICRLRPRLNEAERAEKERLEREMRNEE